MEATLDTNKSDVQNILKSTWSNLLYDDLIGQRSLFNLLRSPYEGDIKQVDDKVKINYVKTPTGEILTGDNRTFTSEKLETGVYEITADKTAIASFDLPNLKRLESPEFAIAMQKALRESIELKIETAVIAMLMGAALPAGHAMQTAATGIITGKDVSKIRALLSKKHVSKADRYLFGDVDFSEDLGDEDKLTSKEFTNANTADDATIRRVKGFIYNEHDLLADRTAIAFHRSAAHVVLANEIEFKISDQHANNKLGYLVSAHILWGSAVFDNKRLARMINKPA